MEDIEIARAAKGLEIAQIAGRLGLSASDILPYGHDKAKLTHDAIAGLTGDPGRLILVTAINPTPAGEGKTTTTVGLTDALNRIGKKASVCIREASLGPNFGMKGGAAGGGYAQVIPMEDMNLHFTGDFHAITAAHNLLAAMIDNHIYWGNALDLDTRRIAWRRVLDVNDRALRGVVIGLGGAPNGFARESGFDITVASEVMAILCLAEDLGDLQARLGRIIIGQTRDRRPVTVAELKADGAMTVLLRDALQPNLVQTLENNPAFVHGGPFANIAHGCNSVMATKTALKLSDYVVTEAGFGADLGAEKFLDIKCRKAGLRPDAAVIVATIRALKMNGGAGKDQLGHEDLGALRAGLPNLARHAENMRGFGLPVVVAINHFASDTEAEIELVRQSCAEMGVPVSLARHWAEGGRGAEDLARLVVEAAESGAADLQFAYPGDMPLAEKIETICRKIYRADGVEIPPKLLDQLTEWEAQGFGDLPVCMAKTQYSFSADPALRGAPEGFMIPVRELRLAAGAGFIVAVCGDIMTMPGLPRSPAAERIGIGTGGRIEGLF
ncbi:MAG: formate--tetrahydrofolate ligase [Paracoccus sp. (in: a-proteobacteria)]|nr:formate--tetrahydrofolate ligase [Paracoccus sp. (in: a-proteobacteria)]